MKSLKRMSIFVWILGLWMLPVFCWAAKQKVLFQERLYCMVNGGSVRIYLLKEEWTIRCWDYIIVLNKYLKDEYNTIMQILSNRRRWDDILYWNNLFEQKKEQFLKLFSQKNTIQTAMDTFEEELLSKSKQLLEWTLLNKLDVLDQQINLLEESEDNKTNISPKVEKVKTEINTKKEVIHALLEAERMDSFLDSFSTYLSLFPLNGTWK